MLHDREKARLQEEQQQQLQQQDQTLQAEVRSSTRPAGCGSVASAAQKSTKRIDQIVKRRDGAGSAHAYRANGIRRGLAEEVRSLARVPGAAKRAIFDFLIYDEKEERV